MIRSSRALPPVGMRIFSHSTICRAWPTGPLYRQQPSHTSRRYNATRPDGTDTQHPTAQAAPATLKSIPGPSWLWLEPIYEPFRRYGRMQQRRPYWTQFISSLVIYLIGDFVAQSISPKEVGLQGEGEEEEDERGVLQEWVEDRDWWRTGRALLIGGAAAVPGYKWFLWLSNSFNFKSSKVLSLTVKVTVNQIFFTPIFNTYFFGMQSFLSGASFPEMIERIKNTVPTSVVNSCKLWPAVTAFSFTYVPLQYRSIFGGVIAIGWQTYLSLLNQRAAKKEDQEHAHGGGSGDGEGKRQPAVLQAEEEKCAA